MAGDLVRKGCPASSSKVQEVMIIIVRRLLVLAALMFWQGGFTFYGAVVIPIGSRILRSHMEQGVITRSVTDYLNAAGAAVLLLWAWDIFSAGDTARWRRRLRWTLWLLLLLTLTILIWLH